MKRNERGSALAEEILALALVGVSLAVAGVFLVRLQQANTAGVARADRTWSRARALADITGAESSAARLSYFDLNATIALIRPGSAASRAAASAPTPTYCGPLDPRDPATWPPSFDPRDPSTFSSVVWAPGFDRRDHLTWLYECTPSPSTARRLSPVYGFGDGILLGSHPLVGPAAVAPESAPLFADQTGDALTLVRTDPHLPALSLGDVFATSSGAIHFLARDEAQVAAIESLGAGDVLVINGCSTEDTWATAIAELQEAPAATEVPSLRYGDSSEPVLRFYSARVSDAGATFRWGLRNSPTSAAGVDILPDASVCVLDRDAGVITYYTARERGITRFYKVVGNPSDPESREAIFDVTATPLTASLDTRLVQRPGDVAREIPIRLEARLAVPADQPDVPAEALHVRADFLGALGRIPRLGFVYGEVDVDTGDPGPPSPFPLLLEDEEGE